MTQFDMTGVGSYIRDQREQAQLSLRQLAGRAGVSNPYLSQVERGLRRPSAQVLHQIADGLRISAESLYVRAGILSPDSAARSDVLSAVNSDSALTDRQREVLRELYLTFREESSKSDRSHDDSSDARLGRTPVNKSGHMGVAQTGVSGKTERMIRNGNDTEEDGRGDHAEENYSGNP